MGYEYVALSHGTFVGMDDTIYESARKRLLALGWEEYVRAPWEGAHQGGVCIMRRPKGQPRMWTEAEIRALFQAEWIQACE